VRARFAPFIAALLFAAQLAAAQTGNLTLPATVEAGSAFSIPTAGSGQAVLYIVGPGQTLRRSVQLGESVSIAAGSLYNAGDYVAILAGPSSTDSGVFQVTPTARPADIGFLARPSRLPVSLHNGISGAVYVFDAYRNLITAPMPVSFELATPAGAAQKRSVNTKYGAAWTQMDSTGKEGADKFLARVGDVSATRIVQQVPGDPCGIKMSAQPAVFPAHSPAQIPPQIQVQTDPIRDCSGNAVPDGTIVTFTENYNGTQSTVDVPIKRGIAQVDMPAHDGATISVASGVVMGNEIRWGK
jgi:hypothetical protein